MYTTLTSERSTFKSIKELSNTIIPPGFTVSTNFSSDGLFIAISVSGDWIIGEPI